jgi:hypothetical protein
LRRITPEVVKGDPMSADLARTALLIMDVQPPIADLGGPTVLERLAIVPPRLALRG